MEQPMKTSNDLHVRGQKIAHEVASYLPAQVDVI